MRRPTASLALRFRLAVLLFLLMAGGSRTFAGGGARSRARSLRDLTGARTRLVWVQDHSKKARDVFARRDKLRLMAFDSSDGRGERALLDGLGPYVKPMLTPDASKVLYSDHKRGKVCAVDFAGGRPADLLDGSLMEVWRDPETNRDWVIVQTRPGRKNSPVRRHLLSDPSESRLVWNRTPVSRDNFQLSADGTRVAGLFPWPKGGVARLPNGKWRQLGRGCWTSLAPDDSYLFWIFDGPHRNVFLHRADGAFHAKVSLAAPTVGRAEVYHPRWSNHLRVLTMTGPYRRGIHGGGKAIEIHVGRFAADFRRVEQWVRVTENDVPDLYPDVWVDGGAAVTLASLGGEAGRDPIEPEEPEVDIGPLEQYKRWPGNQDALIFVWASAKDTNQIVDADGEPVRSCRGVLRGRARFGPHFEMDLADGWFDVADVADALLAACRQSGQLTLEAVITPADLDQSGPARILTFSGGASERNFTLGQEKDKLILRLRTTRNDRNGVSPQLELASLEAGRAHHVVVTFGGGNVHAYVDGRKTAARGALAGSDFRNWERYGLRFGDEIGADRDWDGRLEGVAIYSRFVTAEEAALKYELSAGRMGKRPAIPRAVVEARLVERTATPDPNTIGTYRRALMYHTYELVEAVKGSFSDKRFQVAHWAVLDRARVPGIDRLREGRTYRLTLEPASVRYHPELTGERNFVDSDELDLPRYLDVSR